MTFLYFLMAGVNAGSAAFYLPELGGCFNLGVAVALFGMGLRTKT